MNLDKVVILLLFHLFDMALGNASAWANIPMG